MRLIDADNLIEQLENYAAQETPVFKEDDDKAYDAINQCIASVKRQAVFKPKIAKIDGRLKVRLVKTYEKYSTDKPE